MIKSLGIKRWIAWKLVQLAAKFYYAELHQTLSVYAPDVAQLPAAQLSAVLSAAELLTAI